MRLSKVIDYVRSKYHNGLRFVLRNTSYTINLILSNYLYRSLPPLPPPSTVTLAAPTPPETPVGSGAGDGSPQFVYVSAAVSAAPLTPPASEYSSDAENTAVDVNAGPAGATASVVATVYGLIDYVIERAGVPSAAVTFDPILVKDEDDSNSGAADTKSDIAEYCGGPIETTTVTTTRTTTTTIKTEVVVNCGGNKGRFSLTTIIPAISFIFDSISRGRYTSLFPSYKRTI